MTEHVRTSEIARRAGVSRAAVSNWKQRFADFPKGHIPEGTDVELFEWDEVKAWLDLHKRLMSAQAKKKAEYPPTQWELWRDSELLSATSRARARLNLVRELIKLAGDDEDSRYLDLAERVISVAGVDMVETGEEVFRVIRANKNAVRIKASTE